MHAKTEIHKVEQGLEPLRYFHYAKQAEAEGLFHVAALFYATANNTQRHQRRQNPSPVIKKAEEKEKFTTIKQHQGIHPTLYARRLEKFKKIHTVHAEEQYYLCALCGYTYNGNYAEKCPLCETGGSLFSCVA